MIDILSPVSVGSRNSNDFSLLPDFVSDKLEDANKLMGKISKDGVDKAQGFTNKIQNKLNNIDLRSKGRGKFCD